MDIIKRDFLRLLRSGAFGEEDDAIEPMSRFKWDILFHVAQIHNVLGVLFKGIADDKNKGVIPQDVIDKYTSLFANEALLADSTPSRSLLLLPDAGLSRMCNPLLNSRLQSIREKEPLAEDASIETLNMLDILVQATEGTMTYGLSFANILRIGLFLRNEGDKVDFIKLDHWLRRLNISRMAQLEGSILIEVFGFDSDELPFVNNIEPSARKIAMQALTKPIRIDIEEWKIQQKSTIFLANNNKAMMKTVRNSLKYFFFSPIEASSNFLHRFASSLSNLEE